MTGSMSTRVHRSRVPGGLIPVPARVVAGLLGPAKCRAGPLEQLRGGGLAWVQGNRDSHAGGDRDLAAALDHVRAREAPRGIARPASSAALEIAIGCHNRELLAAMTGDQVAGAAPCVPGSRPPGATPRPQPRLPCVSLIALKWSRLQITTARGVRRRRQASHAQSRWSSSTPRLARPVRPSSRDRFSSIVSSSTVRIAVRTRASSSAPANGLHTKSTAPRSIARVRSTGEAKSA